MAVRRGATASRQGQRIARQGKLFWSDKGTSRGKRAGVGWAPHSGAWTRCVTRMTPHLGKGAKGYCAKRMKEAIGIYPGDRLNRGKSSGSRGH